MKNTPLYFTFLPFRNFRYAPEKIPGLIESNDGDLRNQAGETIAVLYEIARDINSVCSGKNFFFKFP